MLVVLAILLFAEYLSRSKNIHAELTRKLVHMAVGTFVAFWPFFLSWHQIEFLSIAFLGSVGVSIKLNIFRAIHAVRRGILGEVLFAVVIGFLAVFSANKWAFMAALLNLSLADGAAAVIGTLWGDNSQYKVFGKTKSRVGTAAFLVTSFLITALYFAASGVAFSPGLLFGVPVTAAIAENIAVNGIDNLVVPMIVALLLS